MTRYFSTVQHTISGQHVRQYYRATANSPEEELKLVVNQYTPLDKPTPAPGDVTIIACHAAGFFKELYEPFFDDLYELSRQNKNAHFRIGSIWIADMVTHGESGVLNEGKLGLDLNYDDHARDLLCTVNTFRSQMQTPIVGIGHSMGAGQILKLALLHPSLLSSVIAIEPVITRGYQYMHLGAVNLFTTRPDIWPSLEQAVKAARKSVLFAGWDERALQIFFERGFRQLPTALYPQAPPNIASQAAKQGSIPVTLTTTRHHEARAYARNAFPRVGEPLNSFQPSSTTHLDLSKKEHDQLGQPFYRPESVQVHDQLPHLQPRCHYVYAAKTPFISAKPEGRAAKMRSTGAGSGGSGGISEEKVTESVLKVGSHYVLFEHPQAVAEEVAQALEGSLKSWAQEMELQRSSYKALTDREKMTLDSEWVWWANSAYGQQPRARKPRENL